MSVTSHYGRPFAELRRLFGELQQRRLDQSVDGAMVRQLFEAASATSLVAAAAELKKEAER
ncbi:MAG: hypothetical protein ACREVG_01795 [Burkholderiales bacterium]